MPGVRHPAALVGRTALVDLIESERAVVLRGEPGSGKSRLLSELRARDEARAAASVRVYGAVATALEPLEALLRSLDRQRVSANEARTPRATSQSERLIQVREAFERRAANEPLLLQIDDLHRASPAALEAIAYCIDRTEDSAIRWQCAARAGSGVFIDLEDAERDGVLRFIDVPPLDERETEEFARELGAEDSDGVFRATGGNPLYVEHFLATRADADDTSFRGVLEQRVRGLESEPARIAAMLAVAKRPLEPAAVALALSEFGIERVHANVAILETLGIVRRHGEGVEFAHELLRDAAAGLLSASQTRDMHDALAKIATSDVERAEHLAGAQRPQAARDAYLAAARRALQERTYDSATAIAERLEALGAEPVWETRALAAIVEARRFQGSATFPRILHEREGVVADVAAIYLQAFVDIVHRPDEAAVLEAIESALTEEAMSSDARVFFLLTRAKAQFNQGRSRDALATADLALAGRSLDERSFLDVRAIRALLYGVVHDVDEGRDALIALAVDPILRTFENFAIVFQSLAVLEHATDNVLGQWYWASIGMTWSPSQDVARALYDHLAYSSLGLGRPAETLDVCVAAEAHAIARGMRSPSTIVAYRAEAAFWAGDAERVERELAERKISEFAAADRARIVLAKGLLAEGRGDSVAAERHFTSALEFCPPPDAHAAIALAYLTRLAARRGDVGAALDFSDVNLAFAFNAYGSLELCLFYRAMAENDHLGLRARYRDLQHSGVPYCWRALALAHLGERLEDRDALVAAIDMLDGARAKRHAEAARKVARDLGFRPGRALKAKSVLSPRETEVVRFVAQGKTNREIAAALFLSPKTVAATVSSVLTKCGLTSRVDIAARVASGKPFERFEG